jgi:chromodomain-containing protein
LFVAHRIAYLVRDDTGVQLERSVPLDQMKVLYSTDHIPPKASDVDNPDDVYVVEKILNHREKDGHLEYHIKWKNFPLSQSTWVKEEKMNDTSCIDQYFRKLSLSLQTKRPSRARASELTVLHISSARPHVDQ